tara:strand:+ start:603 stop:851 length:249 start_codon:yes stop_codon:yes gene_type:complete
LKINYFANIRQTVGISEENINIGKPCTIEQLINKLESRDKKFKNAFKDLSKVKCAVNMKYTNFKKIVTNKDEVSFFPPVTGG